MSQSWETSHPQLYRTQKRWLRQQSCRFLKLPFITSQEVTVPLRRVWEIVYCIKTPIEQKRIRQHLNTGKLPLCIHRVSECNSSYFKTALLQTESATSRSADPGEGTLWGSGWEVELSLTATQRNGSFFSPDCFIFTLVRNALWRSWLQVKKTLSSIGENFIPAFLLCP